MAVDPDSFSPEVSSKLKTYVYRLIDPRNGETFYVGEGRGNRVFAHIRAEQGSLDGDELDNKLRRIREIHLAGLQVGHVIHRHGMDDTTAFAVEAALMDAYPGLTNIAGGHGVGDVGAAHAREIIQRYAAEPAVFEQKALLINVNRSAVEATSLYEATRYAWKISRKNAMQAEVVLATVQGRIVGAFLADEWMEATPENFPSETTPHRADWGSRGMRLRRTSKSSTSASAYPTSSGSAALPIRSSTPGADQRPKRPRPQALDRPAQSRFSLNP